MTIDHKRIIGGVPTSDFPDCVAVGSANGWCCSGTVVAPNVVLTAAHCVDEGCGKRVFVGEDVAFPDAGRTIDVRSATVHPEYRLASPFGDIAVLVLEDQVDVAPRAIAPSDVLKNLPYVRVVGYGNTNFDGTKGYGRRRQVDVPLAGTSRDYGADQDTEFVAGAPNLNRDSCRGDSGGPAYAMVAGEWLLVGATSRASGHMVRPCGDGGVYTKVSAHEKWIKAVPGGRWA
jgi:secreted trypsin-like serine protease